LSERLLLSLASEKDGPLLWQLVEKAATPTQRAVLVRCLGNARVLGLDERLDGLLAQSEEDAVVAAVEALAASMGQSATARLAEMAQTDERPSVRVAAQEGLATIGSELALPYLRAKLRDPPPHPGRAFNWRGCAISMPSGY
jgi:HEAT repeat protein